MQRTAALLGAAALLVAACGVAHANPDSPADQQKFFDSVKRQGLSGPQDAELSLGRQVCTLVKLGRDSGEIENYLHNQAAITTHGAQIIRVAAELYLC